MAWASATEAHCIKPVHTPTKPPYYQLPAPEKVGTQYCAEIFSDVTGMVGWWWWLIPIDGVYGVIVSAVLYGS